MVANSVYGHGQPLGQPSFERVMVPEATVNGIPSPKIRSLPVRGVRTAHIAGQDIY